VARLDIDSGRPDPWTPKSLHWSNYLKPFQLPHNRGLIPTVYQQEHRCDVSSVTPRS